MSKQKFKKGDNILVIKGIHKGMRGTVRSALEGDGRVRYLVVFKSFKAHMYSYQMRLDAVSDESAIKHAVESTDNHEKSVLKPGAYVMLSKRGLAKVRIDGITATGHSYDWVCDHNFHTINSVDTFGGINFYTLMGFVNTYHFTEEDLLCPKYGVGDKIQFTRETLVKLGVELSGYYKDDTINKLPQNIIGPRKVLSIYYRDDKALYQLDGECFGKFFYEHEIEPAND